VTFFLTIHGTFCLPSKLLVPINLVKGSPRVFAIVNPHRAPMRLAASFHGKLYRIYRDFFAFLSVCTGPVYSTPPRLPTKLALYHGRFVAFCARRLLDAAVSFWPTLSASPRHSRVTNVRRSGLFRAFFFSRTVACSTVSPSSNPRYPPFFLRGAPLPGPYSPSCSARLY